MASANQVGYEEINGLTRVSGLLVAVIIGVLCDGPQAQATTAESRPSLHTLKRMSLEDLLSLDITSVSRQPESFRKSPAAIHVITGEAIRRSGASSLPEALRLADNLQVAQKRAQSWAITARGFNTDSANKLLVLMDGRGVYTPLFSGVFWDRQDYLLRDIDRIEVLSGPGGSMWGANAVNGVVSITTKSARNTQGTYWEGGGGSGPHGFGSLRHGGQLAENVFYRVYAGYHGQPAQVFPDGRTAGDEWRMGRGGVRIDAEPSSAESFTLQGDYSLGDQRLPTGGDTDVSGRNALGRWSRRFADNSGFSLQVYYDSTHLRQMVPASLSDTGDTLAPAGPLVDDLDTVDFDFQHNFQIGARNKVLWGGGYRLTHDVVQSAPALAFEPGVLDQHLYSAFLQDEVHLTRSLALTLGSKVEHNDYTGFEVEPSARVKWSVGGDHFLWAAASRAVRAPSRVDRDMRLPTPNFSPIVDNLLVGGRDFQSETVVAHELGYRGALGHSMTVSISGFLNRYDHIRSTSLSKPNDYGIPLPLYFANNVNGWTHGVELSADYQVLEQLRVHVGYAFLWEDLEVKPGSTDFNNALNETADPSHRVMLRTSADLSRNVEFDAGLRWVDSFVYNAGGTADTVPSYVELEMRLGWSLRRNLELSISGQNLLHPQHLEYVIASPNPREEIERSIRLKLSCEL